MQLPHRIFISISRYSSKTNYKRNRFLYKRYDTLYQNHKKYQGPSSRRFPSCHIRCQILIHMYTTRSRNSILPRSYTQFLRGKLPPSTKTCRTNSKLHTKTKLFHFRQRNLSSNTWHSYGIPYGPKLCKYLHG